MEDNAKEISELLQQDLNDDIVVMKLVTHSKPELVIAGLIKKIKEERNQFNKQIEAIFMRLDKIESKAKGFDENINTMNKAVNFIKRNTSNTNEISTKPKDNIDLYYSKY